jgi:hypothetical protein
MNLQTPSITLYATIFVLEEKTYVISVLCVLKIQLESRNGHEKEKEVNEQSNERCQPNQGRDRLLHLHIIARKYPTAAANSPRPKLC